MRLQIEIDGKLFDVEIESDGVVPAEPPRGYVPPYPAKAGDRSRSAPALPWQMPPASDDGVCRSPLRGIVARVNVQSGERVDSGDVVVVLEAMKMETNITAPVASTVKAIKVAPGDAVQPGQVLVEFE